MDPGESNIDPSSLRLLDNINFYMVTNPLVATPSQSTREEVNETAGVFIIAPDTGAFKEEPADPPDTDEADSEDEDTRDVIPITNELESDKSPIEFSDDDDNDRLVIDHSDESEATDEREGNKSTHDPKELLKPMKYKKVAVSEPQKPKPSRKIRERSPVPVIPPDYQSHRIREAFTNYFKGLRPDFEKLTPQRKELYKTTLRQMMNEQKEQD